MGNLAATARLAIAVFLAAAMGTSLATTATATSSTLAAWEDFERTEYNHIAWQGSASHSFIGVDGAPVYTASWQNVTLVYECTENSCRFIFDYDGSTAEGDESLIRTGVTQSTDFLYNAQIGDDGVFLYHLPGQTGDLCDGSSGGRPDITITVTASGADASFTEHSPARFQDCGGGSTQTIYGESVSFTGVRVSGNDCVLDNAPCTPVEHVTAAPEPTANTTPDTSPSPTAAPLTATSTVSRISSGDPSAPSAFSALTPIHQVRLTAAHVALIAVLALVLSILVAFPKKLFSAAISAAPGRWREFTDWLASRHDPVSRRLLPIVVPRERTASGEQEQPSTEVESQPPHHDRVGSRPWTKAALGVVSAAVISACVDPGFGFNAGSVRVAVSIVVSFVVSVIWGWWVTLFLARRIVPHLTATYQFKPLSLLVVAATVAFTRISGLEPGMIFGLVAGIAIGQAASKTASAKVSVIQTAYAFTAGVVGWGAYSLLKAPLADADTLFAPLLLDTLSGLTVAGFAAAPIALLPVAGMGGSLVYDWSRKVWFALYAIGLAGFFAVLIPMPSSWKTVDTSLWLWVSVLVAYTVVAVVLYLALVRPWEKAASREEGEGVEGEA